MPDNLGNRRLRLGAFDFAQAPALYRLVAANRAYLRRWLDWPGSVRGERDSEAFIARCIADAARGEALHYCIYYDGRLAGVIGLRDIARRRGIVGYWVAEAMRGKGIATDALKILLSAPRCRALVDTVVSATAADNTASRAVAEKCGFRYVETLPGGGGDKGKPRDMAVYEIDLRGNAADSLSRPKPRSR